MTMSAFKINQQYILNSHLLQNNGNYCFKIYGLISMLSLLMVPFSMINSYHHLHAKSCCNIFRPIYLSMSAEMDTQGKKSNLGSVSLVGAGPGDPELLTVQAFNAIKRADLIISDRLVSPEILALADCELKIANKKPGCAEEAQEEINDWVIQGYMSGKRVVRLKIGDPFLFGRAGEEIIEYRKHGIQPSVYPGLSSSYSAPLAANIPLTHRGVANQVLISTGYGVNLTTVDLPYYDPERTVVLLMAVGRITEIASNMTVNLGYPLQTPVCIVERATTPQQRTIYGTLETIGEVAVRSNAKPPATIIIGNVVNVLQEYIN